MLKKIEKIIYKENLMELFVNEVMTTKKPIALFGCGKSLKYVFEFLKLYKLKPTILVDNNPKKIGCIVNNLIIYSPDVFKNNSNYIILITPQDLKFINQIKKQLTIQFKLTSFYAFNCALYMAFRNIQSYNSYKDFMIGNIKEIIWIYNNLADNFSKKVLLAFLQGRITNNYEYYNSVCTNNSYFVEDIIKMNDKEVFIDCGAYVGDTINEFINNVNKKYKKIYAFEADVHNYNRLKKFVSENKIQNINIFNYAVWNKNEMIKIKSSPDEEDSRVGYEGNGNVKAVKLDDILNLDSTFIKMDVEGAEYQAIQGAKEVILKSKPKLAVCVYHKYEDLVNIPKLIKKICPEYKLFLRQHNNIGYDLVLYAI